MAGVTYRDVRKSYGGLAVLHGIDLDIADGELMVLVGPSGCGKSTLLRMTAGLEAITGGEIAIGGRRVNELEPKDRDIAMVFQNYALYPHMTVRQNMSYGLKIRGTARDDIARRVQEAADILQIGPYLDRKPRELSGGQRQRVAMGRAIVREPAVFLFDEPLSNLDAKLRVQMRLEIRQLQRRLSTTSIYVTHDQVEAMTLADKLMVMNAGRAEQVGAPLELYARPATTFVAGFIGSPAMNLMPGTLTPDGVALDAGPRLALGGNRGEAGRPVTVGIRPEHLAPTAEAGSALRLRVDLVETLGADSLVYGPLAEGAEPVAARVPGSRAVALGSVLPLTVAPADVHLFDRATGVRL